MNNSKILLIFFCCTVFAFMIEGCNETNNAPSTTGTTSGLFKSAGTFSFFSNIGNFSATGVFDTLMMSGSASGAFKYTKDNKTHIEIVAYNIVSPTKIQLVFIDLADALNSVSTGTYPFIPFSSQNKTATLVYIPNVLDTSKTSGFYISTGGSMIVNSISATAISGSFSGYGVNFVDTTKTISITDGTYSTPVVEHNFNPTRSTASMVQEIIKGRKSKF